MIPNVIAYRVNNPPEPEILPSYDAEALQKACNMVRDYLYSIGLIKE